MFCNCALDLGCRLWISLGTPALLCRLVGRCYDYVCCLFRILCYCCVVLPMFSVGLAASWMRVFVCEFGMMRCVIIVCF